MQVQEKTRQDPLEPLRQELRKDFDGFLNKAKEIQRREGLK